MSVNAVSSTSLQRDLAGALRLARTGGTQAIDASAFAAASQDAGATQASSSASQASTVATAPALSNDLMASLLQLQSDFSQLGLQNGVTTPADADSKSKSAEGLDASRAGDGQGQVHHHRRHASLNGSDAANTAQASQSGGTTDTAATASDLGNGLQSFLQQVTKAIAAYATGGPVGVAAAALTTSSKA